ncbi:post-transcriptional regulator [Lentibacillus juripiscarius]|uniref:Post-transcriptional regulator n=1 Tax=Lentibacillus juripiscarius TaxID=257446 RepID=A0ABW5V0N1_9BACI
METLRTVHEWKQKVLPALESKASEFRLMGYDKTTREDVWSCLNEKVWKGDPSKRLFEIVQDIFQLSSNVYMSYLTINAHQDDNLMASIAALTDNSAGEAD